MGNVVHPETGSYYTPPHQSPGGLGGPVITPRRVTYRVPYCNEYGTFTVYL